MLGRPSNYELPSQESSNFLDDSTDDESTENEDTEHQANNRQIDTYKEPYRRALFVIFINALNWAFFLYGIFGVIGWKNAQISATTPLSPPEEAYWFITVKYWPSCADARKDLWRLVTFQFSHSGPLHIGGNTLVSLVYGSILETTHPSPWITPLTYQMGVVFGAIGFSYVYPFRGLVGCSSGIYAMIGGCIAHMVVNRKLLRPQTFGLVSVTLALQLVSDLAGYYFWYNSLTAYPAHACGLIVGVLIGFVFAFEKQLVASRAVAFSALLVLLAFCAQVLHAYVTNWPPKAPTWNPTLHADYDPGNCCAELYVLTNGTFNEEEVSRDYICNGDDVQRTGWFRPLW